MGVAVVGAASAGTLLLIPQEKLLLPKAHQTALSVEQLGYESNAWRNDHEQLLLNLMNTGDHFGVFAQDINTGKATPLEPFNSAYATVLKATAAPRRYHYYGAQGGVMSQLMPPPIHAFSPDGKWLLWGDKDACRAVPLDGSPNDKSRPQYGPWKLAISKYRMPSSVHWLHDSRRWIELAYDAQFYLHGVTIHSLDAPNANTPETDKPKTFTSRGSRWPLAITSDDHLLSYEPSIPPTPPALIYYDTPLADAHPFSRKITIFLPPHTTASSVSLPPHTTASSVSLSPDGTRLLWSLRIETRLPGPAWMQAVCARLGMQPHTQRGLWVSRRDGSDMREIGHVVEKARRHFKDAPFRRNPDGSAGDGAMAFPATLTR